MDVELFAYYIVQLQHQALKYSQYVQYSRWYSVEHVYFQSFLNAHSH